MTDDEKIAVIEQEARELIRADIELAIAASARHSAEHKLAVALEKLAGDQAQTFVIDGRTVRPSTDTELDSLHIRRRYMVTTPVQTVRHLITGIDAND